MTSTLNSVREIPRNLLEELLDQRHDINSFDSKILLITGPSNSGKTFIVQKYLDTVTKGFRSRILYTDGFNFESQILFANASSQTLKNWIRGKDFVFIDDAHRIPGVVEIAKKLHEIAPELNIILVFSSREFENYPIIRVYPVALVELGQFYPSTPKNELLEETLIYGCLPAVLESADIQAKKDKLKSIINREMLRDVFELERIYAVKSIMELIKFLAKNINLNISIQTLSQKLNINPRTTVRYIEILKKHYVIHEHKGFRQKSNKEIAKLSKYYFYDNGIRNALIDDFAKVSKRNDIDQLWSNFLVIERHKAQGLNHISHTSELESYFWKAWETDEIDLVEVGLGENEGYGIHAFKFNYYGNEQFGKYKAPVFFTKNYPEAHVNLVTSQNYLEFISQTS